jgi:CRISPR-associated protein Cpf1
LLQEKEVSRTEARKNWQTIENIKELKEGYLSLIVHQLAKLAVENNAIVVMEDLNYGFKDSRAKVEKQIYQKFENMFIKKLQYLVIDKDNLYDKGGVLKAYQLTNKQIPPYKNMGKQNGFLFYIPPDYTSKIDPVTGFVNLLNTGYSNKKNAVELINKFDKIYYDTKNNYFRFEFNYKKFTNLRIYVTELNRTEWSICSHNADRSMAERVKNKWVRQKVNILDKLTELFQQYIPDFNSGNCLKKSICAVNDSGFF